MKLLLIPALSLMLVGLPSVHASTSDAWAEHDAAVLEQCLALSQFEDAEAPGEPVLFSDEAGMTALLIAGTYPQAHMNGERGQELCLFDRAEEQAYIADADTLTSPSVEDENAMDADSAQ